MGVPVSGDPPPTLNEFAAMAKETAGRSIARAD
jgi:hypothetical protein